MEIQVRAKHQEIKKQKKQKTSPWSNQLHMNDIDRCLHWLGCAQQRSMLICQHSYQLGNLHNPKKQS